MAEKTEKEAQTQLATRVGVGIMKKLRMAAVQDETSIGEIVNTALTVELEKRATARKKAKARESK